MTKQCSKCAGLIDHEYKHKAQCKACLNAARRQRRAKADEAKTDPAAHNYATDILPEGFELTGMSQLIKDGKVVSEWAKSRRVPNSQATLEQFLGAIQDAFEHLEGAFEPSTPLETRTSRGDLIDVVPIGDSHVGLMTWWRETGESFDLKIAETMYERTYARLLVNQHGAQEVALVNLGDYYHSDGAKNATTKGTVVDVDGRWPKVLEAGIRIQIHAIRTALLSYEKVSVYTLGGNHDREAAAALRMVLKFAFANEPRVDIKDSPSTFQYLEFGNCLIGFSHGDTCKASQLLTVMATDQREAWGRTAHQHFYLGHVHHDSVKDYGPLTVETVRVLVPSDAWHFGAGFRSKRDIKIDTWHKEHGRIHRDILGISQIMDAN